jgi:hypothetical protein
MFPVFIALMALVQTPAQPVALDRTAWVFSTIGQSEFCNPGYVKLDLRTGRYTLTVRAARRLCDQPDLDRPVKSGRLPDESLARVRAAYQQVIAEGLETPVCREGGKPQDIVISNGGTLILVVATGSAVGSAPDDLGCWSKAATALHDALDEAFGTRNWR